MNTRIHSNGDPATPIGLNDSQPASSGIRSMLNHPAMSRIGGSAGILSTLPFLAAGLITATAGQNLRQNGFPSKYGLIRRRGIHRCLFSTGRAQNEVAPWLLPEAAHTPAERIPRDQGPPASGPM